MGLGPFDLTGGPFLLFYGVLVCLAWAASLPIAEALRAQGRPGRIGREDDLAALAGGPVRLAETALVKLLANGKVVQQGRQQFMAIDRNGGTTAVERAILLIANPASWSAIQRAVTAEFSEVEQRLVANGLMLDRDQRLRLQLAVTAPLAFALIFVATILIVGVDRDQPVGLLVVALIITTLLAVLRFVRTGRTTHEGEVLLSEERVRCERLRRAPQRNEMGQSVALFGTAVLAGSVLANFYEMRRELIALIPYGWSEGGSAEAGDSGCSGGCGGGD